MATRKIAYATATTITLSMASKTSGQARRSAALDNSSNLYLDALVHLAILVGTVTSPASVFLYAYGSGNDASTYETGGSSDADYTVRGDEKLIGIPMAATANTTTYHLVASVAEAYGGRLPRNWGIIGHQVNCGTLSSTEGNHTKHYQGITETVS